MKFFSNLKTITVLTSLTVLVACGTTNKNMDFAQSKTMINNDQEIIKIYDGVCNQFKADTKTVSYTHLRTHET